MHLFRFSYPVSKPYPFPWLTPLVIVGGLLLTVLFSFITYPANAYDMKTETTTDPSEFERKNRPSSPLGWLSGDDLKPKCEPYDLSVGSQFFTTNRGFLYTVDQVTRPRNETDDANDVDQSVPYLKNPLRNCQPTRIIVGLVKDDTAEPPSWWISWAADSWWDVRATYVRPEMACSDVDTRPSCEFDTSDGPAKIEIGMSKAGVAKDTLDYIIDPDSNASFWWGGQLLNTYWFSLLQVLSEKGYFEQADKGYYHRGMFMFIYDPARNKTIHDVDFYKLNFHMVSYTVPYSFDQTTWQKDMNRSLDDVYNNPKSDISLAITEASYFAKILHSFAMADLGNPDIPNMLLKETDLRAFLSGKDKNINRQPGGVFEEDPGSYDNFAFLWRIPPPRNSTSGEKSVPLNESWEAFKADRGALGTANATIYKQYACSVPRRKSWGKIVVLVLVADLVFLQAAWKLLNLVAGRLVERQEPTTAMVCAGCLEGNGKDQETPVEKQNLIPGKDEGRIQTEAPRASDVSSVGPASGFHTASGTPAPRRTTY